ncbi:MAG: hypothetical protein QME51_04185 [Planctomycetota bacterium]|nr:hypothetical protein [Planctomycetota bacterium]
MQNEKLIRRLTARLELARKYREGLEPIWVRATNFYNLKDDNNPWRFVPFVQNYANSIRARWISGIFAGSDFFGLRGRETTDSKNAEVMKEILDYQNETETYMTTVLKRLFRSLSYLGTRITKQTWDAVNECPRVTAISNWDFFPDPHGRWDISRERIRYGTLLDWQEQGLIVDAEKLRDAAQQTVNKDKFNKDTSGFEVEEKARGIKSDALKQKETDPYDEDEIRMAEVTLYQYWSDSEMFLWEPTTKEILTPDGANPLALRKNPRHRRPYIVWAPRPTEAMIYGLSPVTPIMDLQVDLNESRYYFRRNSDLKRQGILLLRRGSGIDKNKLIKEGIAEGHSITDNDIRRWEVNVGDVLNAQIEYEERIHQYADRATNIYDPQRGGGEGKVTKTLGGLNLLIKEGNQLFAEDIANLQIDSIKPLIEQLILLNQENLNEGKTLRITGKSIKYEANQFSGDFDVITTSAPALGQSESLVNGVSFLKENFPNNPNINDRILIKKTMEAIGLDPDEGMFTTEEVDVIAENEMLKQELANVQALLQPAELPPEQETSKEMV